MRKVLVFVMVLAFAATAAIALQEPPPAPDRPQDPQATSQQPAPAATSFRGTITRLDNNAKSLTLRDDAGKEVTIFWNDTTKLNGELKEGASVSVDATDEGGKMTASSISVSSKKPSY
jgi:Cu/Ag efflux protein CusF